VIFLTVTLAVFITAMTIYLYRPPIRKNVARYLRVLLFLCLLPFPLNAQANPHLYSTGSTLELDRCASAWLIKRYVDKDAVFKFFADGDLIEEGTAFDTPDSNLTRTHNQATFEVILKAYKISDQRVHRLAAIIHDVEVNFWGNKQFQQSRIVEKDINRIIAGSKDNDEVLEKCFRYFDRFINAN
jgi:hypothetical protein